MVVNGNRPSTVLIAEDDDNLRELARVSLGAGHRFIEAADGEAALALARSERPQLVVLDLMLPRKSGFDVLAELRRDEAYGDPRVVVITAWAETRDRALAEGADAFLAKPFAPDDLRRTVERLLAQR